MPISASKPSASGPTSRSCAPPRLCSACSRWLLSGRTTWPPECRWFPRTAAWYPKAHCTFSDAIAAVRRQIWQQQISCMSRCHRDVIEIPRQLWERAANALAYAA